MSNINTLREGLFETIQKLKSGDIDIEQAKTIGDLSQVLINSAKVEVDFVRANGGGQSEFFEIKNKQITNTAIGAKTVNGAVTIHKLRG